jgi:hypothetical protein
VEVAPAERTKEQLAQAKAAPAQVNVICKAKALYAYTAENRDEEIDLLEGDVILVEYKVSDDWKWADVVVLMWLLQADNGWWVGQCTRTQRSGIFPGTYVEELPN